MSYEYVFRRDTPIHEGYSPLRQELRRYERRLLAHKLRAEEEVAEAERQKAEADRLLDLPWNDTARRRVSGAVKVAIAGIVAEGADSDFERGRYLISEVRGRADTLPPSDPQLEELRALMRRVPHLVR